MAPTTCEGRTRAPGNPNPVTLVKIVLIRNTMVPTRDRVPVRKPNITTKPETIPIRLSTTCTAVNVASVMPQTTVSSSIDAF
jgi:hypothetical protein